MENNFDKNGLSVEKSLEIISEAINNSRQDFQRRGGTAMLIWGTTVILVSGIVLLGLTLSDNNHLWNLAWFLIPFIGVEPGLVSDSIYRLASESAGIQTHREQGEGREFRIQVRGHRMGHIRNPGNSRRHHGILHPHTDKRCHNTASGHGRCSHRGPLQLMDRIHSQHYLRNSGTALRLLPEHTHSADHGHRSADDPGHPRPDIQPSNQ